MWGKRRFLQKRLLVIGVFLTSAILLIVGIRGSRRGNRVVKQGILVQTIQEVLFQQARQEFLLLPDYIKAANYGEVEVPFLIRAFSESFPICGFLRQNLEQEQTKASIHVPERSMIDEMEQENQLYTKHKTDGEESKTEETTEKRLEKQKALEQTEASEVTENGFVPVCEPVNTYDWSEEWDYTRVISNFYAVDQNTYLLEKYADVNELMNTDVHVDKSVDGPQILIYHTHSQECFADSEPGNPNESVVGAGEKLSELLRGYGFRVLHHTQEYDIENRDHAYNNALPEIEKLLEENPTIEVVIDLHRDEMAEDTHLVTDIQGRPTARFMFFNGMSYLRKKGEISYLENPYIKENLALSFQAQVIANEYYPGLARRIYLKAYRYNMHLKPKSMLIELGAQNNSVEEIMNACDPLAHIISIVLEE